MKKQMIKQLSFVLLTFLLAGFVGHNAFAFMEVSESGELTPQSVFRAGVIPQVKTSDGSGANISGFVDTGLNDETSARLWLGSGDTDFVVGGTVKWIPIPDYDKQPAIGGRVGAFFFRKSSESYSVFRFDPLISKKFDTDLGELTPYAALPILFFNRSAISGSSSTTDLQLVLGSEYVHPDVKKLRFGGEIGFNVKDSFSYIAAYVSIALDDLKRGH